MIRNNPGKKKKKKKKKKGNWLTAAMALQNGWGGLNRGFEVIRGNPGEMTTGGGWAL